MKRIHYAWAICLGGALSLFLVIGLGINIFAVYQPYIIEQNAFTNAQGSWITTVRSLFTLLAMLTVNQLCGRMGLRRVMTLGCALLAVSYVVFGLAGHFLTYCLGSALTGLAYGYGGMVPLSLVIGHWFQDRRSFALGLASAGSGVSTIFAPTIVTWIIETYSMQTAFLAEAAVILILTVLVWLLVRSAPEELGMHPYHLGLEEVEQPEPRPAPEGMNRRWWYALLAAAFLVGAPCGPGFSHLTVLYTSSGYDSLVVAVLFSFLGFMISVGKIIGGQAYDVLGGWRGNFYMSGVLLVALGLGCLAPLGGRILPVAVMILFGLGLPLSALPFAVWARDLLGDVGYEGAVRSLTVAYAFGMLVFGPLPGILADWTGSYVPAYALFALILMAAMAIVQGAYYKLNAGKDPARR